MAEFLVTTTANSGAGSLRAAIAEANAAAGADTIRFDQELAGQTIRLASTLVATEAVTIAGDLGNDGDADITITGDAAANDIRDARGVTNVFATPAANLADNVRILRADTAVNFTLDGLVLTGDVAEEPGGVEGAVVTFGSVTLTNSLVSGNSAESDGGGVFSRGATLTNSTVSDNRAGESGGGVSAGNGEGDTATLVNSTVSGNSAEQGGGIRQPRQPHQLDRERQ